MLFDSDVQVAPNVRRADRGTPRQGAAVAGVLARDPPRRARDPLRPRCARDHAGELRGPSRRPAPVRGGVSATRSSSYSARPLTAPPRSGRQGRPLRTERAPPDRRTAVCRPSTGYCRPIVQAEERRAGAHLIGAPKAVTARDQVGLRALNDLLKAAFDQPGIAAAEPGDQPATKPPTADRAAPEPEPEQREQARAGSAGRGCRSAASRGGAGSVVQAVPGPSSPRREAHGHAARRSDPGSARNRGGARGRSWPDRPCCARARSPNPAYAATAPCRCSVRARVTVEPALALIGAGCRRRAHR